jgi:hypothetical protein
MEQKHVTTQISDMDFPWEGAFVLEDFRSLRLSLGVNAARCYSYLGRQIQRWPKELAFHVCRIECALLLNNEDAVYAAVLDLFYILDAKGNALRQRVLGKVSHHLSIAQQSALERCLNGQLPSRNLPYSSRSVLHEGMHPSEKNALLLPTTDNNQSSVLDPVNTARLCLESGQLEQAQKILESQLAIEPEREEIRQDLLEIYCATRDEANFMASYQLLQVRGLLDDSWKDAVTLFSTAN